VSSQVDRRGRAGKQQCRVIARVAPGVFDGQAGLAYPPNPWIA
jgi:hypothetical protein